jgi:glycine/D-amino acid oxidase-like deaminating enzyme
VSLNIVVIGAGVVRMCCASYLQRDGHSATVIYPVPQGDRCDAARPLDSRY